MDKSIFTDKKNIPQNEDLIKNLDKTFSLWETLKEYVYQKYPKAVEDWNYPGEKYGWSFRIKDKKRTIIYFLPRDKFFKVAFVFGQKATDLVMKSQISNTIKSELESAKVYAEGRGIRIDIKDENILTDIKQLIDIKLTF
jgi:hypothetical protein